MISTASQLMKSRIAAKAGQDRLYVPVALQFRLDNRAGMPDEKDGAAFELPRQPAKHQVCPDALDQRHLPSRHPHQRWNIAQEHFPVAIHPCGIAQGGKFLAGRKQPATLPSIRRPKRLVPSEANVLEKPAQFRMRFVRRQRPKCVPLANRGNSRMQRFEDGSQPVGSGQRILNPGRAAPARAGNQSHVRHCRRSRACRVTRCSVVFIPDCVTVAGPVDHHAGDREFADRAEGLGEVLPFRHSFRNDDQERIYARSDQERFVRQIDGRQVHQHQGVRRSQPDVRQQLVESRSGQQFGRVVCGSQAHRR